MPRSARFFLLFAAGLAVAAPAAAAPVPEAKKAEPLYVRVAQPVNFGGLDDPKLTLANVLEHFTDRYEIPLDINEGAFKAAGVEDPAALVVQTPLRAMKKVPLERLLRKVLARVPVEGGATFLVRKDVIEITTMAAMRAEIWGKDYQGTYLPLVQADFEEKPLHQALRELAEQAGWNIVIDARMAEKAKAPVTAKLVNVPLDTAVRMLADMAGLRPYLTDNLVYVTSKDNAARLEEEARQRQLTDPQSPGPRIGSGQHQPQGPAQ